MITGHTNEIKLYDTWFAENYNGLRKYCKKYQIEEDLLNETYINCKQRILKSGFTYTYFTTYVKHALRNLQINEAKKQNGKYYIEIENEDYINNIETRLQEEDKNQKDTQAYREEIMYFSKMMFMYIMDRAYNDEWQLIFRCYFLMPKRFTYKKLHEMTGINKNHCTKVISTMKKDIRTGFLPWLKTKQNTNDTR